MFDTVGAAAFAERQPGSNYWQRASAPGHGEPKRATISHPGSFRSLDWPPNEQRARRLPLGSSSAPIRWTNTFGRCSKSSASPRGARLPDSCRTTRLRPSYRNSHIPGPPNGVQAIKWR
jgi:hypothetical protein